MGYQWSKQKELKKESIPNVNSLIEMAKGIKDIRIRCLFCLLYLTAGRIGELIPNRKRGIFGIKKKDIGYTMKKDRKIILIDMRNEKNKKRKRKEIPVPLDIEENKAFWDMIKEYLDYLEQGDELFPFSYQYAYRRLSTYYNPHWFRHIRLTHLITVYDFNESLLQKYAGWTDARPAKDYAELNWKDFLDKF